MDKDSLKEFIGEIVEASGRIITQYFGLPDIETETKPDQSPVTVADRKAEEIMRGLIRKRFPEHGIMGEEFGNEKEDAQFVWVLDPIDGTRSFIKGCPLFATLIGLLEEGRPILGAIHNPLTNQLLFGDNQTTTLNGQKVRMRPTKELSEAVLLCGDLDTPAEFQNGGNWKRLMDSVKTLRTWGDGYGYLLGACGGADIITDPIMAPWDLLPLIPVIRGAGGVITDWQGNDPVKGNSIVAANPELHPQVIAILNA